MAQVLALIRDPLVTYGVPEKSHKMFVLMLVLSEKIRYLENETIFFRTVCVGMHRTLAPIIYI